jgi:hypothetical protein
MKITYISLLILLIFATCKKPEISFCENELSLIQADSLSIIQLDFEQSKSDFEKQLLAELGVDSICAGSKAVGLPLRYYTKYFPKPPNSINIQATFYNNCRDKNEPIFCGIRYDFPVLINSDTQILIDGELVDLQQDSISKAFQKIWEVNEVDFDKFKQNRFILKVFLPLENDAVKTILKGYTHFYLTKIDEYCQKEFNQKLSDIDKKIVDQLKKDFPFQVYVCYTRNCSLMPSPPPPPF